MCLTCSSLPRHTQISYHGDKTTSKITSSGYLYCFVYLRPSLVFLFAHHFFFLGGGWGVEWNINISRGCVDCFFFSYDFPVSRLEKSTSPPHLFKVDYLTASPMNHAEINIFPHHQALVAAVVHIIIHSSTDQAT